MTIKADDTRVMKLIVPTKQINSIKRKLPDSQTAKDRDPQFVEDFRTSKFSASESSDKMVLYKLVTYLLTSNLPASFSE